MKYEIKHRWTGAVIWAGEIDPPEGTPPGAILGIAIRAALKSGAILVGAKLDGAILVGASLDGASLDGAILVGASLDGASLRNASLRNAILDGASLRNASLDGAILDGASLNIPVIANIHQAVYAAASAPCALDMDHWHAPCGTTHCRAGWVTTLAGEPGLALELAFGTSAAAALIYQVSDPTLSRVPDFHCTDSVALADMKRLAELERAS